MKNLISENLAAKGILAILSIIVVFHILVLSGIIPFEIVWGGRLKDQSQMVVFEIFSILINLVMLAITGIRSDLLKIKNNRTVISIAIWIMFFLFILNTMGNILSENDFEKIVFTPLTLLLSLLTLRLAIKKA